VVSYCIKPYYDDSKSVSNINWIVSASDRWSGSK